MKDIEEYSTKSGKKRYKFTIYNGKDASTGKSIIIRKQGFKSARDAKQAYLDVQQAILNGEYTPLNEKRLTVKELYKLYLPLHEKEVKGSSIVSFKSAMKLHILPVLGNTYLDKLTTIQCQKLVNSWADKYKKNSFNSFFSSINEMLVYAVKMDLLQVNPLSKVIKPRFKEETKRKENFYSKDELELFLQGAKKQGLIQYTLFYLLAYTGLRIGEAVALTWADIDFNSKSLTVSKTITKNQNSKEVIGTPKTKTSNRTIFLTSSTIKVLLDLREAQLKDTIYIGASGSQRIFNISIPTVGTWCRKIAKKQGVKRITVHGFRHTHASLCFEAGMSMQEVKNRLGHANISITMDLYTHVTKGKEKAGVSKLENYMNA